MLDALVAEARVRWGLDPAQGLQVVAIERLIATPIDPSRPLLLVPAALLGADARVDETPTALPGRHGPRGLDPLAVLHRLYPGDHAVGRFGAPDATTVEGLGADDLATALYVGPVPSEHAPASPWALPWLSARLRAPDGCPWDREQTHESLRGHLLE
jgi:hypothetical protein